MKPQEKERLIGNIVASLSNAPRNIQERQLCHFFRADPAYGGGVAKTLGIYVQELGDAK
jgi:catalase